KLVSTRLGGLAPGWRRLPDASASDRHPCHQDIARRGDGDGRASATLVAMRATHVLGAAAAIALLSLLVVGGIELSARSSARSAGPRLTLAQMRARLARSPAPLVPLHAQSGELLSGGLGALRSRLPSLRGTPLVV